MTRKHVQKARCEFCIECVPTLNPATHTTSPHGTRVCTSLVPVPSVWPSLNTTVFVEHNCKSLCMFSWSTFTHPTPVCFVSQSPFECTALKSEMDIHCNSQRHIENGAKRAPPSSRAHAVESVARVWGKVWRTELSTFWSGLREKRPTRWPGPKFGDFVFCLLFYSVTKLYVGQKVTNTLGRGNDR